MVIKASIIVASYNRKNVLARCLSCLTTQTYSNEKYEIIVVDDGSTDGTANMLEELTFPCRFLPLILPHNIGLAAAHNVGIAHAVGEIVIFIDSDIFVPRQFIAEHMRFHEKFLDAIVDGPAINIYQQASLADPPFNRLTVRMSAAFDFFGKSFITANTSVPRKYLTQVNGFDESFGRGYGWEDSDLGRRLRNAGLTPRRNRRAYALHYKAGKATLIEQCRVRREMAKNALRYYRKFPYAEVRREIRYRYLDYEKLFNKIVWLKNRLNIDYLQNHQRQFGFSLLRRCWLISNYAEELRKGLAEENTPASFEGK